METDQLTVQDTGVAKIRALLIAARPLLQADAHEFALAFPKKPVRGQPFPDPSSAISHMRAHLQALRAAVLAGAAAGVSARDLTALTLLETDQSLDKLAQSYAASDHSTATELREESIRLANQAKGTSVKASKALGIPWPL